MSETTKKAVKGFTLQITFGKDGKYHDMASLHHAFATLEEALDAVRTARSESAKTARIFEDGKLKFIVPNLERSTDKIAVDDDGYALNLRVNSDYASLKSLIWDDGTTVEAKDGLRKLAKGEVHPNKLAFGVFTNSTKKSALGFISFPGIKAGALMTPNRQDVAVINW